MQLPLVDSAVISLLSQKLHTVRDTEGFMSGNPCSPVCVLNSRASGWFLTRSHFSYDSVGRRRRLRPRWDVGAGGTHRCDCWAALPAVCAAGGGRVPVSVSPESLQPQAKARGGRPVLRPPLPSQRQDSTGPHIWSVYIWFRLRSVSPPPPPMFIKVDCWELFSVLIFSGQVCLCLSSGLWPEQLSSKKS